MLIFLIGMPGSGKSYWANLLAKELGFSDLDTDDLIENSFGSSITMLFSEGESSFRQKEQQILLQILNDKKVQIVVATGGGLPAFGNNLNLMKQHGLVVYLAPPLEQIIRQVTAGKDARPLLANESAENLVLKMERLYASRQKIYEQAHIKIDPSTISVCTFVALLKPFLNKNFSDNV